MKKYTQMNLRSGRMAQVRRKEESRLKVKDCLDLKSKSKGRIKDKSSMGWMLE